MAWFLRDRRGISWRDQTLESISAPPAPLIVFFGLVMLLMFLASYSDYKAQVEKTKIGARLFLFLLLPLLLIFIVHVTMADRWFSTRLASPAREMISDEGSSPWGLLLWVVLLLVMVHYQSSFQSNWFRIF